jgi:hypothetical protein
MGNAFVFPFNYRPSARKFGDTGTSYTCPSGKYAMITATLYVSAYGQINAASGVTHVTTDSNAVVVNFWVDDGDVVTATVNTTGASDSASTGPIALSASGIATILLNTGSGATQAGETKASATAHDLGTGTVDLDVVIVADVNFIVDEYDVTT